MKINTIFILLVVLFAAILNTEAKFTKSTNSKGLIVPETSLIQKAKLQTYKTRSKVNKAKNCPLKANGSKSNTAFQGRNINRR